MSWPSDLVGRMDAVYADRPHFFQLRARAMMVLYLGGFLACLAALTNDLAQGFHAPIFHFMTDGVLALTMWLGIGLVWTGRDHLATYVVPLLLVMFSISSLAGALDGKPELFYGGWARWYPVFIAVNGLLMTQRFAVINTALSVAWTAAFYPLFRGELVGTPHAFVPGDAIDMISIELLTGVITIATIRFIEAELTANRTLNAGLEAIVVKRTQELSQTIRDRQTVLDNMAEGIIALGADGSIRLLNDQLTGIFGIADPDQLPLIEQVRQSGIAATQLMPLPDGRDGKVTVTPLPGENAPYGVVAIVRDVTLEREVDRLKTEFISTVSHELRTPMTSVLGFAKMIRRRLSKRVAPALPKDAERAQKAMAEALENLGIVVSEGERLTELINDVLDIAKMEAGRVVWRRNPIDVSALVTQSANAVAALFSEDRDVTLGVVVDPGLPEVVGDEHRLIQLLVNLLSNASKFTDSGTVTLQASVVDSGIEFSVTDTGSGVADTQQEAIFGRFRQAEDSLTDKPSGTGLGLAICQQIARAHDSEVHIVSAVGEGSRFSFVLPAS